MKRILVKSIRRGNLIFQDTEKFISLNFGIEHDSLEEVTDGQPEGVSEDPNQGSKSSVLLSWKLLTYKA